MNNTLAEDEPVDIWNIEENKETNEEKNTDVKNLEEEIKPTINFKKIENNNRLKKIDKKFLLKNFDVFIRNNFLNFFSW